MPAAGKRSSWWTSRKRIATLRRMYAAGCTDEEIGLALGISKGAVNGKRWRLGLVHTRGDQDPLRLALRRSRDDERRTERRLAAWRASRAALGLFP